MKPRLLSTARLSFPLASAIAALLAAPDAHAAIVNWDGDTSVTWSDPLNWDTLPTSDLLTDIANFNLATYGGNPIYAPDAGTTSINGLTIGALNGAMTLTTTNLSIGTGGIAIANGAGAFTITGAVTAGAIQAWTNNSTSSLALTGALDAGSFALTFAGAGNTTLSSAIANGAALTKSGAGILTLAGTNGFTSGTINGGTITGGSLTLSAGATALTSSATSAVNSDVTITTAAGTITSSAGTLTLGGALDAGSFALTFDGAGNTIVSNTISNGTTLTKSGAGILTLSGSNTYTGTTTVSGGILRLNNATALPGGIGATGGTSALTVSGGVVELANGNFLRNLGTGSDQFQIPGGVSGFSAQGAARIITVNNDANQELVWGSATFNPTTLVLNETTANNTLTLQNKVDLGDAMRTVAVNANTATISGNIRNSSGTAGLTKTGSGTLVLSGSNSYSGGTVINAGTLTLSGANTYTGGTVLNAGQLSTTADNNLGSGGGITVNGTSMWNMGTNVLVTYNRSLTVNDGAVLSLASGNATKTIAGVLSGTGSIINTATTTFDFTNTGNTFTGTVNNGYETKFASLGDSANPINLVGSNSNFTWSGGLKTFALRPFTIQAAGTGNINSSGSGALTIQQPLAISGAAGARTLSLGGANTGANQFAGIIADGSGSVVSLTKKDAGTWILSGANTYTGKTTISGGTLSISSIDLVASPNPLGQSSAAAANLLLGNGTTLRYTGAAASTDRSFTINGTAAGNGATINASGSGAINFNSSTPALAYGTTGQTRTLTLTGTNPGANTLGAVIGDNGGSLVSVTKAGIGTWVLSGANTYTGVTTINQSSIPNNHGQSVQIGTLVATTLANGGSPSSIGQSTSAATNLLIGNGTVLKYTGGAASTDRAFTINGTGDDGQSGALDASGSGAINWTSTAAVAYGTTAKTRTLTLTGNSTANNTLSALIGNNGTSAVSLAKAGQGTWVLNGPVVNTYAGGTNVNTGTLVEDFVNLGTPTNLINSATPITFGGGTLSLLAKNNLNSAQTLPNPTFSSQAGSGISVTGTGTGTMTLTLGNTWTRNQGSTLNVTLGANGTLTSNPTVANTLVVGSGNIAFATVGGTDWAKVSGGTVVGFVPGDYTTPAFAGNGNPATGTDLTTGNYSITDSATVTVTEAVNTLKINTTLASQSLAITTGQTLTLNAGGLLFTGANDYSITGGTLAGSGGTQKDLVVHQFGSGNLTISSALPATTVLTKTGTGTLILDGANTFTGATYLGGGGALVLKNQLAVQNSVLSINNSGLVFDSSVAANAFTIGALSANYAGPGYDVALQNNAGSPEPIALTVGSNNAGGTYYGTLSGAGSLIKVGTGNQALNGINTYTGGTIISAGTVECGIAGNDWFLGGSPGAMNVTVQSGASLKLSRNAMNGTLTLNGGNVQSTNGFGSSWDGSIILGAGTTSTFTFAGSGWTVPAAISGSGALTNTVNSPLTLSGYNTYTGATTFNSNTNTIALSGTLGGGGGGTAITTWAPFNETATGVIAGTSSLTVYAGTTTLAGANTYTGNTTLVAGTIALTAAENANVSGPLGKQLANAAGTIVFARAGGVLQYSASNAFDYSGRFSTAANQVISVDTNGQNVTWATGLTSSGGALFKSGLGTLILSGTNTYSGATSVSVGTLQFNNVGAIAGSGRTIAVGGGAVAVMNYTPAVSYQADIFSRIVASSAGAVALNAGAVSESLDFSSSGNNLAALSLGANGAVSYTGTLTPNANTYRLGGGGGTLTFTPGGGTFDNTQNLVLFGAPVVSGVTLAPLTGTVDFAGASKTFGTISIFGGTTQNGSLTGSAYIADTSAGNATVAANLLVNGSAGLTVSSLTTALGANTLNLTGANTYTGDTVVNSGTLNLGGGTANGSLDSGTALKVSNTGSFVYSRTGTNSQTVNGLFANNGASTIANTVATDTLTLGAITRVGKGTVNFGTVTGAINTTTGNTNSIIGTWATTGATTTLKYAVGSPDGSTATNITGFTGSPATANTLANVTSATTNYEYSAAVAAMPAGTSLTGNTLRYSGGATATAINATSTLSLNGLMNAGSGGLTISGGPSTGGILTGSGGSSELVITGNGQLTTITAVIGGTGSVTFSSAGALTGAGSGLNLQGANTFNGFTLNSGTVFVGHNQALGTGPINIYGGVFDGNGNFGETFAATNTINVYGNFSTNNNATATWNGAVNLAGSYTIGVTRGFLTLNGVVADGGNNYGITKAGTGALNLGSSNTVANTYTGKTILRGGTTVGYISPAGTAGSFGAPTLVSGNSTIDMYNGSTLQFSPGLASATKGMTNRLINLADNGAGTVIVTPGGNNNGSTPTIGGFTATGTGAKTLTMLNTGNMGVMYVTGSIPDSSDGSPTTVNVPFASSNSNEFHIAGVSTFTGPLTIGQNVANIGGKFFIDGTGQLGSGSYANNIVLNGLGSGVNTGTFVYNSSANQTLSGVISGAFGAVTKQGAGTLTLTGVNTYAGVTTVSTGKLTVAPTGTINSTSSVTIGTASTAASAEFNYNSSTPLSQPISFASGSTGGTLSGTGTIGTAVNVTTGNSHAPGNSGGIQEFSNSLAYAANSSLQWQLMTNQDNASGTAGTDFDQVSVTGGTFAITTGAKLSLMMAPAVDFSDLFWTSARQWTVANLTSGVTADGGSEVFALDFASIGGTNWSASLASRFAVTRPTDGDGKNDVVLNWLGDPYTIWTQAKGLDGSNNGLSQNPDVDGYTNLIEYAFDTDPLSALSGPGAVEYDAVAHTISKHGQPTVTVVKHPETVEVNAVFGRRKDYAVAGLIYTVQFSADMSVGSWESSAAIPSVLASDATLDVVQVPYPLFLSNGKKAAFFRVEITKN